MTQTLQEIVDAVERIKRDYPDVPVRFEFAPDVWEGLLAAIPIRHNVSDVLTGHLWPTGVPCVVDLTSGPGEWGPVFRTRG